MQKHGFLVVWRDSFNLLWHQARETKVCDNDKIYVLDVPMCTSENCLQISKANTKGHQS